MRQRQPRHRPRLYDALLCTSALVALSLAPAGAQAQTSTWTGAVDSTYGNAANWTGGSPPPTSAGKSALFDNTGSANTTVNVTAPITVQQWTFNGSTGYTTAGSAVTFTGAGAGLVNTSSAPQVVGNVLAGSGATLTQNGAGSLTLSGANTYTGTTTVSAGTLTIIGSGSITSNVTNNATFNNLGTVTGNLTNNGSASNPGGTITGNVVNSGQFSNGFGRVHGDLTNSGNADLGTFGGGVDGRLINNGGSASMGRLSFVSGGVVVNGGTVNNFFGGITGGVVVNGGQFNNNFGGFDGGATVNGGLLSNTGSITGNVTVNNGGTLSGGGRVTGNVTVNGGGIFSPLIIDGNLVLGAGAIYKVAESPGVLDRTFASGAATLAGAVQIVFGAGTLTPNTHSILLAQGGRSGTFDNVTTSGLPAFLIVSLSYTATDVLLTLRSEFGDLPGLTSNERAVGRAQDIAFNNGLPLITALQNLAAAQIPAALDQLSGEVHASTVSVLADESLYARSAILGRLRQASFGDAGTMGAMAALSIGGPRAAFADGDALTDALAYAKSPIVTKAPPKPPQAERDVVFWAQGFGAWGRFDSDGNAASVRRDLAGFITGVDTRVGASGRAGLAAGYTSSRAALDSRGSADVESGHVAAYGGWSFGALNLRGGGAFAFHSISTDRTIAFPGFFDRAFANYDGNTGQIFGEAGYGFALGTVAVEPFAGGAWVRVHTDAARERALAAGLNFAGTTFETGYSSLGIRAATLVPLDNGMVLIPRASLAWQHAFDSVTPGVALAFQAAPTVPFTISGVPIARDAALAEAGLDLALNAHATIGVSYTGQIAGNVQDHAARGKFSWKF